MNACSPAAAVPLPALALSPGFALAQLPADVRLCPLDQSPGAQGGELARPQPAAQLGRGRPEVGGQGQEERLLARHQGQVTQRGLGEGRLQQLQRPLPRLVRHCQALNCRETYDGA